MQGHAGANLVPVVASNRIGKEVFKDPDSEITFYGTSFIAGASTPHLPSKMGWRTLHGVFKTTFGKEMTIHSYREKVLSGVSNVG